MQIKGPALMLSGEIAAAYKVTRFTVDRWRKAGKLHTVRTPGGRHLYFRAELQALMNGTPLTEEQISELRDQLAREGWL